MQQLADLRDHSPKPYPRERAGAILKLAHGLSASARALLSAAFLLALLLSYTSSALAQGNFVYVNNNVHGGPNTVSADNPDPNPNNNTTSVPLQVFDVCLQDDSNPDVVFLGNSVTGDYRFCCNATVFSSRATVSEGQHRYLRAQRRGPARIGRGEMRSAPGLIKGLALPPALLEKPVCWSG